MATYIEDLVQNIYTNCDMSGLDKLNKGLQDAIWYSAELEKNLRDANKAQKMGFDFHSRAINRSKEAYQIERQKQNLEYQQAKYRLRLNEQEEIIDNRRKRRQDAENKRLSRRNWLQQNFARLAAGYIGLHTLKNIFDTGSRLQLVQKSIEGLTKSTQDWKYVQDQAFRTGTDIEVVAKGYRNFFSSANMAGFGKGQIQGMYADVLLSTRAIGASTQQTEGALLALEQMISKGRVSMEELRRQLGNAIPGAFEIGAKAMNMTTAEFNDFVKTGKLASTVFVPLFIKALKEIYADGFKDIEQTVSVANARLINAWKELTSEIISGETGKALAEEINSIREIIASPEFKEFIKILGTIFALVSKILVFAIKHFPLILIYLGLSGLSGALKAIITHILSVQLAFFQATGTAITFGQAGTASFIAMGRAALGFMATMAKVLAPLLLLEDVLLTIGKYLWGWNVETAISDAIEAGKQSIGNKNLNMKTIVGDEHLQPLMQRVDKAVRAGDYKELDNIYKTMQGKGSFQSYSSFGASGGSTFAREENNKVEINLGGVNLYSSYDNPVAFSNIFSNEMFKLLTAAGVSVNVPQTIGAVNGTGN